MQKAVFYTRGAEFDGSSVDRSGVGGAESALTYMACEFFKLGLETHVYCNCRRPRIYDGVIYHHFEEEIPPCDYLFCYRFPEIIPLVQARVKVLVLHDMPVIQKQIAEVLWAVDKVFFLSEFQKKMWLKQFPSMFKIAYVTSNGFVEEFATAALEVNRDHNQVVWASRPERGLDILLEDVWPELSAKHPNLRLVLAGYGSWDDPKLSELYKKCDRLISQAPNIVCRGSLPKKQFYALLKSSACVLYPAAFPEISCLVAIEAQAVGTPIVTTDAWALPETVGLGLLIKRGEFYNANFISAVSGILNGPPLSSSFFLKIRSWSEIALDWLSYLQDYTRKSPQTVAACIVAKNEEDNIIRCLKSLQHSVHYIKVLVDSSQDQTYELALKYADEVVNVSFSDLDFSELRKVMVKGVKQDWVLWMDADEILIKGENLIKYTKSVACEAYRLKQVNVTLEPSQWGVETPVRLFRNQRGVSFVGKIHEQLEFADYLEVGPLPLIKDLVIVHLGYISENLVWEKFYERNIALLEEEEKAGSNRPLLPIYRMRDYMNRFIRENETSFKFPFIALESVIKIWENVFEGKKSDQIELAWGLYQRALREIASRNLSYRGCVPFLVQVEIKVGAKKGKLDGWFRNKGEFQKEMKILTDYMGGLSGDS